jgi:hypothetical protein
MARILYHGSNRKFDKFEITKVADAIEQEGPGIYLTTSEDDAKRYGKYLYTVKWTGNKTVSNKPMSEAQLRKYAYPKTLIRNATDWKETCQNFDEDYLKGYNMCVEQLYETSDSLKEFYLSIWGDFYRTEPEKFCYVMNVRAGIDGLVIDRGGGLIHVVAYNPKQLKIIDVKEKEIPTDLGEAIMNELQDSTPYFNPKVKKLQEAVYTVYHGTDKAFDKFDVKKGAQNIGWFSDNYNEIAKGESGAVSSKVILKCKISIKNPAGWDEYEDKSLWELQQMGYDGVILPIGNGHNNYIVFKNSQVKILKESKEVDTEVTIKAHDAEGIIEKMFDYIKKIGNQGHSFSIEVDPDDKEYSKLFGWDGDGSAYIDSIDVKKITEDITLDIDKGDTILTGRFKNHKVEVKDIDTDEHGMPTVNGKQITKIRIPKLEEGYLNNKKMTPQDSAAQKQLLRVAGSIGFPKTESVEPRKITFEGKKINDTSKKLKETCVENKWTKDLSKKNSYKDPSGKYRIVFNESSIELKHVEVNEGMSLIDKIMLEAVKIGNDKK